MQVRVARDLCLAEQNKVLPSELKNGCTGILWCFRIHRQQRNGISCGNTEQLSTVYWEQILVLLMP